MPYLIVLFLSLPFLELATFFTVAGQIGLLAAMLLLVATSMLGVFLFRLQGAALLASMTRTLRPGVIPDRLFAHGALISLGAGLLILPGFLTDLAGLLLFLPPVRAAVIAWHRRGTRRPDRVRSVRPGAPVVDLDAADWSSRVDGEGRLEDRRPPRS